MKNTIVAVLILFNLLICNKHICAQKQSASSINDFVVTITFAQTPSNTPIVKKAPLKYNKDFAFILHMDDGNPAIHELVMPFFKGQNGNPGLFFTEGNPQNNQPFKMDAVHFTFNGLGVDMHNYVPGFLHWDNLISLWAGEFGIVNHGLTDPPTANHALEVRRSASYTKRKTASGTIPDGYDMNVYVIPNNVDGQIQLAKTQNLAVYHQGLSAIENPLKVETLPPINGIEVSRASVTNNLFQHVQAIANQCNADNHFITTYYNHGFGNVDISFEQFKTQMNQIAATYGKNGSNTIWSASSSEVFEYLRIKELVTVNTELNDKVLKITFLGNNIPVNFRYYALTLTVEGESNIVSMEVQQPDGLSTYLYNSNKALLNLKWNGQAVPNPLARATAAVVQAEQQVNAANALVAMDYVQMLPSGVPKEQLRLRLCALPGIAYEAGFCKPPEFLGADTTICLGDSIRFTAPQAAFYLWSTGATTQSLTLKPTITSKIWARVTDHTGFVYADTVKVTVLPLPNVIISPPNSSVAPGTPVQLTASGAQTYLWSTGAVVPVITVSPTQTSTYWVEGKSAAGCTARTGAIVQIVYTTTVDFTHNTACLGDTTFLIAKITTNDSIIAKEWDLTDNGLFNNASGDTVRTVFNLAGSRRIGLRVKTSSGEIITKYNNVLVAGFPVARMLIEGNCLLLPTKFTDNSISTHGTISSRIWSTGDGNQFGEQTFNYSYVTTGNFNVKLVVVSSFGCKDSVVSQHQIRPLPDVDLRLEDNTAVAQNQEIKVPKGGSATFKVASQYETILWPGNITTPTFRVVATGTFFVEVKRFGCPNRRNFSVLIEPGTPNAAVGIMNLITPNGDGFNDVWLISDLAKIAPARVTVYTRSGVLVYQKNDYKNDWNGYYEGNPLPEGTYYYMIETADKQVFKGPLSILR